MPKIKNIPFWKIQNLANDANKGEIYLYGDISSTESWWYDDITPKKFKSDLENLGDVSEITLHINSGGGDVFAANTIYSLLKNHSAKIVAIIDGLCASAATIPALAADVLKMHNNGLFMLHNPSMGATGESEDLRKAADLLVKVKSMIMTCYMNKTGLSEEEVSQMMDETTWLTGKEALEKGFIDEVIDYETEEIMMSGNYIVMNSIKHDTSRLKNFPTNKIKNSASKAPKGTGDLMTPEEIRNKYPEVFAQIVNAAQANERDRIKAIDNLALSGAEDIIQNAKSEGLSEAETAIKIVNWQKENSKKLLNQMKDETESIKNVSPGSITKVDGDLLDSILNKIDKGGK